MSTQNQLEKVQKQLEVSPGLAQTEDEKEVECFRVILKLSNRQAQLCRKRKTCCFKLSKEVTTALYVTTHLTCVYTLDIVYAFYTQPCKLCSINPAKPTSYHDSCSM